MNTQSELTNNDKKVRKRKICASILSNTGGIQCWNHADSESPEKGHLDNKMHFNKEEKKQTNQ